MVWWVVIFLVVTVASVEAGGTDKKSLSAPVELCSSAWVRDIEDNLVTDDGQGHGPDAGSLEWKSVVEFRLGIRNKPDVPDRSSKAWCQYIDQIVTNRIAARAVNESGPSFPCNTVDSGSIEAMVCRDEELSLLDRKLSSTYAAASSKAVNEHPPLLKSEQRGWIKGRNECWKSVDRRGCVRDEYIRRIAGLQARYRLVSYTGPVRFICDDNPVNEVFVIFFQTSPRTLIAERGDSVSLMYIQPSASGDRYRGRNETLWVHQGEAFISWGYDSPEMRCKAAR